MSSAPPNDVLVEDAREARLSAVLPASEMNGVSAPISEPAGVGETRLTAMADALVIELNYEDLRRLIELLAERIAVDV